MTVRSVGACVIDFTRLDAESDQLSCYYPLAGRYQFFDEGLVETGDLDGGVCFGVVVPRQQRPVMQQWQRLNTNSGMVIPT